MRVQGVKTQLSKEFLHYFQNLFNSLYSEKPTNNFLNFSVYSSCFFPCPPSISWLFGSISVKKAWANSWQITSTKTSVLNHLTNSSSFSKKTCKPICFM